MRIAINATILDEKPTGLGNFTINIIKELAKLINDENSLIVYTSTPEVFQGLPVKVKKAPDIVQPQRGKVGGIARFIWTQLFFPYQLKQDEVDVLYSTTHHGLLLNNTKQILTIHDILALKYEKQHKLQYYYFKFILPTLVKSASRIVTVSENTKKDIVENYEYPYHLIDVVHNSFDKPHFENSHSNQFREKYGDYLLFIGASYPHKNLERAIRAFLSSDKKDKMNFIVVGGNDSYKENVKQQFTKEELRSVHFLNYVSYQELPIIYSNAKALVYPSLYEGFGIPPLEAMASGCPVIVSNTSSIPEVCGDAALYFDPEDVQDIASAINEVTGREEIRKKLIRAGYERVKLFSWEKSAKSLKEIIENANNQIKEDR